MSVVDTLLKSGAVAIVRTADQVSCQEAADAIVGAGLTSIEITLTTPGALDVIASLATHKNVCVGVGTVLTIADVANAAKLVQLLWFRQIQIRKLLRPLKGWFDFNSWSCNSK